MGSGEAKGCVFRVRGCWRPCPCLGSTLPWLNAPPQRASSESPHLPESPLISLQVQHPERFLGQG